ncbi:MAG: RNase adapter RapZ [Ignavibacteriaceae bacterium]|nr:RNase adapter RapZ [Ignavibacteriaceae bacterium]
MTDKKKESLLNLYYRWSNKHAEEFIPLPKSGSYREYYRLKSQANSAIAVYNADKKENRAFIEFSKHFREHGLPVPEIYEVDLENDIYLIEDLGNITLFSYLTEIRSEPEFSEKVVLIYKKVIDNLPRFQIEWGKSLNYSICYPRAQFDEQSMMWDLNYFKYYFLKLGKIPFDEQALETDFHVFTEYLLSADCNHFLYRDFQSRNIMIKKGEPYFIDYQGGRKGALQYDLASLLFDAKADLPHNIRAELLQYYISKIKKYTKFEETEFIQMFFGYVLIRILQALGAYGFRGFYEKKEHFLKSIPYAIDNLAWLMNTVSFPIKMPSLFDALKGVVGSKEFQQIGDARRSSNKLEVSIFSFSYRQSIPQDQSGNGGGFVFDCRAIHNPGRYNQYKMLTGKDEVIKKFFIEESEADKFLSNVFSIIQQTINVYITRKFAHLMISFGCTGGQHRSVYCAERMAEYLRLNPEINVKIRHMELEKESFRDINPGAAAS